MALLMAVFVMGSVGTGVAGTAAEPAPMSDDAALPTSACPDMDKAGASPHTGHAGCAMTLCCFSDAPDPVAHRPEFVLMPASYVLAAEARLTQAEPERDRRPPKHA